MRSPNAKPVTAAEVRAEKREKALAFARAHPDAVAAVIAQRVGANVSTVHRWLQVAGLSRRPSITGRGSDL